MPRSGIEIAPITYNVYLGACEALEIKLTALFDGGFDYKDIKHPKPSNSTAYLNAVLLYPDRWIPQADAMGAGELFAFLTEVHTEFLKALAVEVEAVYALLAPDQRNPQKGMYPPIRKNKSEMFLIDWAQAAIEEDGGWPYRISCVAGHNPVQDALVRKTVTISNVARSYRLKIADSDEAWSD